MMRTLPLSLGTCTRHVARPARCQAGSVNAVAAPPSAQVNIGVHTSLLAPIPLASHTPKQRTT